MAENKRYFKREWEEEYYIFDSTEISEKRIDEWIEYDYNVFANAMTGDTVVNKLNEQEERIKELEKENRELHLLIKEYEFAKKEGYGDVMTEKYKVIDGFDYKNEPCKLIESIETEERYSTENELEANSLCKLLNEQEERIKELEIEEYFARPLIKENWVSGFLKGYKAILRSCNEEELEEIFDGVGFDWKQFNNSGDVE